MGIQKVAVLKSFLEVMVAKKGSHLFLSSGTMPSIKIGSDFVQLGKHLLSSDDTHEMARQIMSDEQAVLFSSTSEIDLVVDTPRLGRFSVNVFKQRNKVAMVFKIVKTQIPSCDYLGIPHPLKSLCLARGGLLFFCGRDSDTKTAAIAALIDHRNRNEAGHIVTLEEPISYVHPHQLSIVSQREIGIDTPTFLSGIESSSRQAPDMLFIGDVENQKTVERAISLSQAGCLCLISLNTENSEHAVDRLFSLFPQELHQQLYMDLSLHTEAIFAIKEEGDGNTSVDMLLSSPVVKKLLQQRVVDEVEEEVEKLVRSDSKSVHIAFKNALSASELKSKQIAPANSASSPLQPGRARPVSSQNDLGWEVEPIVENIADKRVSKKSA